MKCKLQLSVFITSLLFLLCSSFSVQAGKKHCQIYRDKLNNIQAQQRQSNTLKRSNSLKEQEAKARKRWWDCETGKLKKKVKKKKAKSKKTKGHTQK